MSKPRTSNHANPQKILSTDDEYKHRWLEWYMADGTMIDSRKVNWRLVHWEKVVRIVMRIKEHVWEVNMLDKPSFQYFLCFRRQIISGPHKRIRWIIGWSDGTTAFLRDFDMHTGDFVREYEKPMTRIPGQIHPRVGGTIVPDFAEA